MLPFPIPGMGGGMDLKVSSEARSGPATSGGGGVSGVGVFNPAAAGAQQWIIPVAAFGAGLLLGAVLFRK